MKSGRLTRPPWERRRLAQQGGATSARPSRADHPAAHAGGEPATAAHDPHPLPPSAPRDMSRRRAAQREGGEDEAPVLGTFRVLRSASGGQRRGFFRDAPRLRSLAARERPAGPSVPGRVGLIVVASQRALH
eukprot:scaffold5310_cov378-Prasinococcus_capsulatus_cf.AAC.8